MEDLISIIVPVYNVEKYVEKCIKSIINQTYKNIEIIIVDDGSTDISGKICDKYENKDNRIKVLHKKNGGLSDARNIGIDIAKGKYILFVDSDDYIDKKHIEYLYKMITENNADISICQFNFVYENDNMQTTNFLKKDIITIFNNIEALETMLYNKKFCNSACTKLYKAELFDNIRFPIGKLYEDLGTTYKLIEKSKKVVLGKRATYNYLCNRKDSIVNRKFDKRRMDAIEFAIDILNFVKDKYPTIENAAIARLYMECIFIIIQIEGEQENKDIIKYIYKYLNKYRINIIFNSKVQIKFKLFAIYSKFGIKAIKHLWNIKNKIKALIKRK